MEKAIVNQIYSESIQHFTFWGMFCTATLVVKVVILILICLSIYSWSVMIAKVLYLRSFKAENNEFYTAFWGYDTLIEIYNAVYKKGDLYSTIFMSIFDDLKAQSRKEPQLNEMHESIARIVRLESFHVFEKLWENLGVLASIGSVTPFIGLLGTVWGIMDSFQSIGITKNANLAAVAPGVAEALFTTALALMVTIPAVMGYNKIVSMIQKHNDQLDNYIDQLKDLFTKGTDELQS